MNETPAIGNVNSIVVKGEEREIEWYAIVITKHIIELMKGKIGVKSTKVQKWKVVHSG